ncbi:hypothetical protein [Magnetospirillum aberrantis]|uniref:Uncharacterized protein n=1 Tax=Magnetospirillum aberrantis SpK TaxID=908842 RepID=A0A7C9UVN3_9PROT|nr:hypothetical protein [Magnetospirillum aberrantis]NFV81126.1 hypothetical protein [Magnetospirillum aberrantis SpK]
MAHRIVVCTDHSVTWECLRRFSASAPVTLERVARLEDLSGRDGLAVDAVVVDDRFLPIIAQVQRSARRHSPIFGHALFMTAGEALNALWNGPLGGADHCSAGDLSDWVTLARGGEVDDLPF